MKVGIFVTSYCETENRFQIIKESISTLLQHGCEYDIIIVNDGTTYEPHEAYLEALDNVVYIKQKNLGIAKAKNRCIKYFMDNDYDVGFLADDDLVYCGDVFEKYIAAHKKTDIHHFSLFVAWGCRRKLKKKKIQNFPILPTPWVNGPLLFITKQLIKKMGGFKIFPYKYGHEHSNFSIRAHKFSGLMKKCKFVDICDAGKLVKVHEKSVTTHSIFEIDWKKHESNSELIWKDIRLFEEYDLEE